MPSHVGHFFFMGALAALGFAPFFLFPLTLISFALVFNALVHQIHWKPAFKKGYAFGCGYFLIGLHWVPWCFTVHMDRHWYLIPPTLIGMPMILSLFTAGWAVCVASTRIHLLMRPTALALIWMVLEWVRGTLIPVFPWNLLGHIWGGHDMIMQMAAFVGVWGLGFFTMLSAMYLWPLTIYRLILQGFLYSAMAFIGWVYIHYAPLDQTFDSLMVRIVQPSISQKDKSQADKRQINLTKLLNLSTQISHHSIDVVIWPETAIPYHLANHADLRVHLAQMLEGKSLITGAPLSIFQTVPPYDYSLQNGVVVQDGDGRLMGTYAKHHLVPFGEYVPSMIRSILPGLVKLTMGSRDFVPGPGPATFVLKSVIFAPFICYEGIFSGQIVPWDGVRPHVLLNITNDEWFGASPGTHQHFAIERFRAVEEGLPMVRVANGGISAFLDAHGRVIAMMGIHQVGVLDHKLPPRLRDAPPMAYQRYNGIDWIMIVMIILSIFIFSLEYFYRRKKYAPSKTY